MKIGNIKGIVWDMDGTLFDSFSTFENIISDVVKDSGHEMPSRESILENYHGSLEEILQKILGIGSATELEKVIEIFTQKEAGYYNDDLESQLFKDAVMLASHAGELGIHQLVVTNRENKNGGTSSPKHIIAATTLAGYIHEVNAGDEVDFRKPDSRSMGDWIERYNLSPDKVIVIGDQYVDAQLAINIGARAILVQRNGSIPYLDSLTDPSSVTIVKSLEEIEF
jgi:phosphoglycolate phosphatase-like HAD superfamily hydrolase